MKKVRTQGLFLKMRDLRVLLLLIVTLALLSCSDKYVENNASALNINLKTARDYKLSDIFSEIIYIPLKLPNDEPLGKGRVKIKNSRIYFWDVPGKAIHIFGETGFYIGTLNRYGHGAGEYLNISDFFINDDENQIEVWDNINKKIYQYDDLNFGLVNENQIEEVNANTGFKLSNDSYLFSTNRCPNFVDKKLTNADYILSKGGKIKRLYFDKLLKKEASNHHSQFSIYCQNLIKNEDDEIFASVDFDNTFYRFYEEEFHPYLRVKFSNGKSIDNEYLSSQTMRTQLDFFLESDDFVRVASYPTMTVWNRNIKVINYLFKERKKKPIRESLRNFIIYKKDTLHVCSFVNDLSKFPEKISLTSSFSFGNNFQSWYQDYLVEVIYPYQELASDETVTIDNIGEIKANDNPIILLLKLK